MKKFLIIAALLLPLALGAQEHTGYTLPEKPNRAKYIDFPSLDRGLWFAVQLSPGINFNYGPQAQLDVIAGYRFGEFFRIGAGISPQKSASYFTLPIFLDLRGNIISQESRMVVPYWNLDAGYVLNHGVYASPTIGIRVGQPRNNFIAGVTYILQHEYYDILTHAIGLRIGYEF